MSAIGSLVFCTACGNLLDGSSGDAQAILTCEVCGTENKGQHLARGSEDNADESQLTSQILHRNLSLPNQNLVHSLQPYEPNDQPFKR